MSLSRLGAIPRNVWRPGCHTWPVTWRQVSQSGIIAKHTTIAFNPIKTVHAAEILFLPHMGRAKNFRPAAITIQYSLDQRHEALPRFDSKRLPDSRLTNFHTALRLDDNEQSIPLVLQFHYTTPIQIHTSALNPAPKVPKLPLHTAMGAKAILEIGSIWASAFHKDTASRSSSF